MNNIRNTVEIWQGLEQLQGFTVSCGTLVLQQAQ